MLINSGFKNMKNTTSLHLSYVYYIIPTDWALSQTKLIKNLKKKKKLK